MSQPTKTQTHIDGPLTNISVAYKQDQTAFIADKVAPIVEVSKQSDKYFIFDRSTFMRDDAKRRGAGEESAGSGYGLSNDSYYCDVFAIHKDISDNDRANTDDPLNQDRTAAEFCTHQLLVRREREWASACFTTGVWGEDVTGASTLQWSDYGASDPIRMVDVVKRNVVKKTGRMVNKAVLGMDVFLALKEHPAIVDRIKYTSDASVTEATIARLLGVDQVYVPYALVDTASEGASATSIDFIVGAKSALFLHVPARPSLETPSAAYTFSWTGAPGTRRPMGLASRRIRMEHLLSDRIETDLAMDIKIVGSDLGVFLNGIVA